MFIDTTQVTMRRAGVFLAESIVVLGILMFLFIAPFGQNPIRQVIDIARAATTTNITSQVIVGNAAPTVTAVTLNGGNAITLTANATTSIYVNFTVTDNNGCGDVFFSGNLTTTAFRAALGAACTASNLNCYISSTSTHSCSGAASTSTSANATATMDIYYFAQATDASSSFSSDSWDAFVVVRDSSNSTSSASSTYVELNTLLALDVTTSSIIYGTLAAGTDTGATNQTATSTNAGNASTSLRLHASATLTSGANSISTSSQRYSTSTFTYTGTSTALTDTAATVSGITLTAPTSTTNVARVTFWGLSVASGTATGTYTGTNVFSALFQP